MCPQMFGKKIAKLRLTHQMTQKELAKKLSLSENAVSKWETGRNLPDIILLPKIATLFGVSVDFLVTQSFEGDT